MKLRLRNEFGVPVNLAGAEMIKVTFPYHGGKTLTKTEVDIIDTHGGIIEVKLSDFEIQGLQVGEKQTFWAYLVKNDEAYKFQFLHGLTVKQDGERKVIG